MFKQIQTPQTQLLCSSSVKQSGLARNADENNSKNIIKNTRQRRAPFLMPMDASSASDKKRKVIEGESSRVG
jgi:hypothetical protein